jgi:hypothetical protein
LRGNGRERNDPQTCQARGSKDDDGDHDKDEEDSDSMGESFVARFKAACAKEHVDPTGVTMMAGKKRARVETSAEEKVLLLQKRIDEDLAATRAEVQQDTADLRAVADLAGGLKMKSLAALKQMKDELEDLSAYTVERVAKVMLPYVTRTGAELTTHQTQIEKELKVLSYGIQQMLANNIVKENGIHDFKALMGMIDSAILFAEGREAAAAQAVPMHEG